MMKTDITKSVFLITLFSAAACFKSAPPLALIPVSGEADDDFVLDFPLMFEGRRLRELPDELQFCGAYEKTFSNAKKIPGHVKRFRDAQGEQDITICIVNAPTRLLLPASDNFRTSGYDIKTRCIRVDIYGRKWGSFIAVKKGRQPKQVCELIHDTEGLCWSNVPDWYRDAFIGKTAGPWTAYTVITQASLL